MSYIELLNKKYNVNSINEETAKKVFNNLEKVDKITSLSHYERNKDNKLTFFFPQILAEKILKDKHVLNLTGYEKDTLLYKNGVYQISSDLRNQINKNLHHEDPRPETNRNNTLKEIRERGFMPNIKINEDTNLINFKNGMYDIKNRKIIEHSPNYFSTIQVQYNYIPNLHIEKDINRTLFGHLLKHSLDKDTITILQEIFGYVLCRSLEAQKFFIFLGKAHNGKTQILNILKSFFISRFVSSLELKHFQDDVRIFSLYNKVLNICSDISSEYIEDDSILKRATGEDEIHCNPKYRDGFDFYNMAKLLFSCNEMPNVADKSMGFMRRLIIIPFDKIVEEKNKITSIGKLITLDKETMEMIVSWAVEGLHRLIENNWKFSETGRIQEVKRDFELENNSVKKFIYNYCNIHTPESTNYISCVEFKLLYEKYCYQEGISQLKYKKMKETIESLNIMKQKNTLFDGWYYKGMSFKSDIESFNEDIKSSIDISEKQYIKTEQEGKQLDYTDLPIPIELERND